MAQDKRPTDTNARLLKLLQAPPEVLEEVDRVLEGKYRKEAEPNKGPILMGMGEAARLLGCSRTLLWRLCVSGRLERIQLLEDGCYKVRRADVEALADGKGGRQP